MPDISFDESGRATFSTRYHGRVTLSKKKWDEVCEEPERWYYKLNGEKVGTTLINPDKVIVSPTYKNQFRYYKAFSNITIRENVCADLIRTPWFCVILDSKTKRVCTVYPVSGPRPGKEFKDSTLGADKKRKKK